MPHANPFPSSVIQITLYMWTPASWNCSECARGPVYFWESVSLLATGVREIIIKPCLRTWAQLK